MKVRSIRNCLAGLALALLPALWLGAEPPPEGILNTIDARYAATVDWGKRELLIRLSAPVDKDASVRNRAGLLSRKESELREFFPTVFPLCLHDIRVDSRTTLKDLMAADRAFSLAVQELVARAELRAAKPSKDLRSIQLEYRFALAPHLQPLLTDQTTPLELPRLLAWQPGADYTGLIVYVDAELPWYGTDGTASLEPCLFPRLYDDEGRLLLDVQCLSGEAVASRGSATYAADNASPALKLAGAKPLAVSARAVYGERPTDVMISQADADVLLYNQSTREALRQGKVVFVVKSMAIEQTLAR